MKNKPFFRSFLTLLFALICMGGISVTAYAQGNVFPPTTAALLWKPSRSPYPGG